VSNGINQKYHRTIARYRAGQNDGLCGQPGSRYRGYCLVDKTTVPRLRAQDVRILWALGSYVCLHGVWKGARMKIAFVKRVYGKHSKRFYYSPIGNKSFGALFNATGYGWVSDGCLLFTLKVYRVFCIPLPFGKGVSESLR
jgi:hypothetical protein